MSTDKRKFEASISVRIGTQRVKLELSPASLHGGPEGLFRVRVGRRWRDTPEGQPLFFDQIMLAELVASVALGTVPCLPAQPPSLPRGTRVGVRYMQDDTVQRDVTRTSTPPIRAYDGQWYVGIMTYASGFIFVPLADVTPKERHEHV